MSEEIIELIDIDVVIILMCTYFSPIPTQRNFKVFQGDKNISAPIEFKNRYLYFVNKSHGEFSGLLIDIHVVIILMCLSPKPVVVVWIVFYFFNRG